MKKFKIGKKRLGAAALAVCTAMAASTLSVYPSADRAAAASAEDYYLIGGILSSQTLNGNDAVEIQKYLALIRDFDAAETLSADANCDGTLTLDDVISIMAWCVDVDPMSRVSDYA